MTSQKKLNVEKIKNYGRPEDILKLIEKEKRSKTNENNRKCRKSFTSKERL